MKSNYLAPLVIAVLFLSPSVALANTASPLFKVGTFHLIIGNSIIGLLEGYLLSRFFEVPERRALVVMILANYFSAWMGYIGFIVLQIEESVTVYNANLVLWGMMAVSYVATLILEWPFVYSCVSSPEGGIRRSLIASILVQSLSYICLCFLYSLARSDSLISETKLVPPEKITTPENVRIYYISDEDGDVYSLVLGEESPIEKVFELNSVNPKDSLSLDYLDSELYELVVFINSYDDNPENLIRTGIIIPMENCPKDRYGDPMHHHFKRSRSGFRLGDSTENPWKLETSPYRYAELTGENASTSDHFHLKLDVLFIRWIIRGRFLAPQRILASSNLEKGKFASSILKQKS